MLINIQNILKKIHEGPVSIKKDVLESYISEIIKYEDLSAENTDFLEFSKTYFQKSLGIEEIKIEEDNNLVTLSI